MCSSSTSLCMVIQNPADMLSPTHPRSPNDLLMVHDVCGSAHTQWASLTDSVMLTVDSGCVPWPTHKPPLPQLECQNWAQNCRLICKHIQYVSYYAYKIIAKGTEQFYLFSLINSVIKKTRSSATTKIASGVWNGHSRSLKVIRCCANWCGIYDFPLALNSNLTSIFNLSWDITPSLHIHTTPPHLSSRWNWKKTAGSRWRCFGVSVPRTMDYPTINLNPR